MQKIIFILLVCLIPTIFAANESQLVITCPKIMPCVAADGSNKNQIYADINQQAYECFQNYGEVELAKKAAYEQTHCLTIYGAANATIDGKIIN